MKFNTREEALKYMQIRHLESGYRDLVIGHPQHLHGLPKFIFEFYGTEEECYAVHGTLGGAEPYDTKHPSAANGGTWRWNMYMGKPAEDLSEEMLPFLYEINSPKAEYCVGYKRYRRRSGSW